MTTFYLDPVNGNDAADGSTFALGGLPTVGPWKTITSGATAARIAPGDVIRIAKSPDPTSLGQTALWTDLSRAVVLQTGAVTANVLVCDGTTGWTSDGGANVTLANDTTNYKLGTANGKANNRSSQIQVGAGFTTGLAAHADLGASGLDLSGYRQCSFWFRPSVDLGGDGRVTLALCSDQAGTTPVLTCSIPRCYANQWVPLTFDLGTGNLGTIKSVAINIVTDFGAVNLSFDNILACKAPGNDALTLQSLISKNSAAQGGIEAWYAIQSINGTSIYIDNHTNCAGNAGRGYTGTTETVTIYKRETIKTTMVASGDVQAVQDNGTVTSYIEFQGGYNTSSGLQDGETFFDGLNGLGNGINSNNKNYIKYDHLSMVRYNTPIVTVTFNKIYNSWLISNGGALNGVAGLDLNNVFIINFSGYNMQGFGIKATGTIYLYGSLNRGFIANGYSKLKTVYARNNAYSGIWVNPGWVEVDDLTTSGNGNCGLEAAEGSIVVRSASIAESTPVNIAGSERSFVSINNWGGADDQRIARPQGWIYSETSIRHTASGKAWKLSPNPNATAIFPLFLGKDRWQIAVNANAEVTVSLWMRKTHATGITGVLACRGGQIAGVDNDVTQAMSNTADAYEQVTITFTPTEAGVVEIEAWAYGGTAYSVYVDDLSVSQA